MILVELLRFNDVFFFTLFLKILFFFHYNYVIVDNSRK